jgi:hypothetical protein
MESVPKTRALVRAMPHRIAVRRIFLEACKLPSQDAHPRPLVILDKKSTELYRHESWQQVYGLTADGKRKARRPLRQLPVVC